MSEITAQNEVFESIKRLCTNYQKDSASRKGKEYLTQRLVSLENLWQDFGNRHNVLLEREDKEIQYFTGNIYEKTKHMYESTRIDILQRLLVWEGKQAEVVIPHPTGVDTKTKELLDRQECHIKALERAMSKIEIDSITEKWELEDHLSVLKTKWDTVEKCHWELEAILKGSNEIYNDLFANKERQYDVMKRSLNSKLWTSVNHQNYAPRIQLPEFTGNYSQWITFKDMFLETIHNNANSSKAQKMQHLKSKLKGEPERLVQHLVGAENYETCWDILIQRYDNKRLQFTNLMNTLMELLSIQQVNAAVLKRMHDVINECMNGLHNIGLNTSSWDPIIVYLMAQKLDSTSYTEYTRELEHPKQVPELSEFLGFLETKFMALEAAKGYQKDASNQHKQIFSNKTKFNSNKPSYEPHRKETSRIYHASYGKCLLCSGFHVIMQCPKFIEMDTRQRNDTVRKLQICKNCLYKHGDTECTSNKTCKECNKPHHTMLHYSAQKLSPSSNMNNMGQRSQQREHQPSTSTNQHSSNHLSNNYIMEILLTTVELQVKTSTGDFITLRALLDQGSQVNLITENAAQRLKLPRKRMNATISGVGTISGDCKGRLELECKSRCTDFAFSVSTLIMKRITNNLPNKTFKKENWPQLQGLKLADPDFNLSRSVDLLLGADIYSQVILEGVLKGDAQTPTAQQTRLGWILCGKLETFNCHVALVDLNDLKRFWETEDIIQNTEDTSKDDWCENYYKMTTERDRDGKYIVKMPLIPRYEEKLGNSKSIAISQFLQLERKFDRNPKLASMYKDFIREYIDLGHMKLSNTTPAKDAIFLPHHGVLREQSTTTKLRAVFNASQKTMGGCSLNDVMEKGPNLQKDIQALILQWRGYKYVYTADIEKMYRSIWCHPDQQHLQKIIWRKQPKDNLQEYQLQTLTYGTKSAPWLAMRTLKQLAIDDGHKYPKAAEILLNQFYVDDLISGHNSTKQERGVSYRDVLAKAKATVDLKELGITGGLRLKVTATGARVLEIPGETSGSSADALAEKLRASLNADEARVSRPVRCADLRILGLDDSVTEEEVVAAFTRTGGCPAEQVNAGTLRPDHRGMRTITVNCPVTAARAIVEGRRLLVGWVSAQMKLLEPRPLRCFRCHVGHQVSVQCTSEVDRSGRCFRCSQRCMCGGWQAGRSLGWEQGLRPTHQGQGQGKAKALRHYPHRRHRRSRRHCHRRNCRRHCRHCCNSRSGALTGGPGGG